MPKRSATKLPRKSSNESVLNTRERDAHGEVPWWVRRSHTKQTTKKKTKFADDREGRRRLYKTTAYLFLESESETWNLKDTSQIRKGAMR